MARVTAETDYHTSVDTLKPKISLCQHIPIGQNLEENYARAEVLVRQAASEGCDLAVLPEFSLALPVDDVSFAWADEDYKYLNKFQALAKELQINLVPGTIGEYVAIEGMEERMLTNNAYFIDRQGQVLGEYRKKNLWHPEREYFYRGDEAHYTFDTPEFGRVGLLICWDLAFPEAFRELVKQGVNTVIAPTCWTFADAGPGMKFNKKSEGLFLDALCTLRAFENEIIFVFCNIGALDDDKEAGGVGLSQITAPFYGQLAGFQNSDRGVLTTEVDYSCLSVAESVYKVRMDMAKTDWHYAMPPPCKCSADDV